MIDEFKGPTIPMRHMLPKDTAVIGTVPEDLQKMLSLSMHLEVDAKHLVLGAVLKNDEAEAEKDGAKAQHMQNMSKILLKVFWLSLEDHLGITEHDKSLGIAKGWQVYIKPAGVSSLEEILSGLQN